MEWLSSKECSTISQCRVGGKVKTKTSSTRSGTNTVSTPAIVPTLIQNHKVSNNQQVMIESPMSNPIDDGYPSDCV